MESGDCGCSNSLPFSSIFDINPHHLTKTNGEDEMEDKSCNVSSKGEKAPRKVIHFSDGTIEEYSSDEDEPDTSAQLTRELNPSTLAWGPWIWHQTSNVGTKSLQVCDFLGEHLASFFGITTPKYQYEIDEYNRVIAEEEERKKEEDLEMGGWKDVPSEVDEAVQAPPHRSDVPDDSNKDSKF